MWIANLPLFLLSYKNGTTLGFSFDVCASITLLLRPYLPLVILSKLAKYQKSSYHMHANLDSPRKDVVGGAEGGIG